MQTPPVRTQNARTFVGRFLDWFLKQPLYIAVWFIPLVALLYIAAVIQNLITGEK